MTEEYSIEELANNSNLMKSIEFAVITRINVDSDEQVTVIANPQLIQAIRLAIANGSIFKDRALVNVYMYEFDDDYNKFNFDIGSSWNKPCNIYEKIL